MSLESRKRRKARRAQFQPPRGAASAGAAPNVPPASLPAGVTSFAENDRLAEALEALLKRHGIDLDRDSDLERVCLGVKRLLDMHIAAIESSNEDLRGLFRDAVGFRHLAQMIVKSESLPGFDKMVPHLELLNRGSALQNTRAAPNDPASNKLFELLLGLAALNMPGASVDMDHPENAKGNNPDVLVTLGNKVWGFACKVPNGIADMSLFENIEKGIDQIEKSVAGTGFVVLNFKNVIPHDELFPIVSRDESGAPLLGMHRNVESVTSKLREYVEKRLRDMLDHVGVQNVLGAFAGKKALPGVLVVVQAGVGARLPETGLPPNVAGKPVPTFIGFLQLVPFADSCLDPSVMAMLNALNQAFYV
jgi:hypothetical protein